MKSFLARIHALFADHRRENHPDYQTFTHAAELMTPQSSVHSIANGFGYACPSIMAAVMREEATGSSELTVEGLARASLLQRRFASYFKPADTPSFSPWWSQYPWEDREARMIALCLMAEISLDLEPINA